MKYSRFIFPLARHWYYKNSSNLSINILEYLLHVRRWSSKHIWNAVSMQSTNVYTDRLKLAWSVWKNSSKEYPSSLKMTSPKSPNARVTSRKGTQLFPVTCQNICCYEKLLCINPTIKYTEHLKGKTFLKNHGSLVEYRRGHKYLQASRI